MPRSAAEVRLHQSAIRRLFGSPPVPDSESACRRLLRLCTQCKAPIIFHRHGVGREKAPHVSQLRLCHACSAALGSATPRYPQWPDESTGIHLMALASDFEACPCSRLVDGVPCAVPFFAGMHQILCLLNGRYGERQLVLRACGLLREWPERFVRCGHVQKSSDRAARGAALLVGDGALEPFGFEDLHRFGAGGL